MGRSEGDSGSSYPNVGDGERDLAPGGRTGLAKEGSPYPSEGALLGARRLPLGRLLVVRSY